MFFNESCQRNSSGNGSCKMRILLINPPKLVPKKLWEGNPEVYPPLGLAYIASVLREKGHEVKILDCLLEGWQSVRDFDEKTKIIGLDFNSIGRLAKTFKADVVGITGMSFNAKSMYLIAKTVKDYIPDAVVILGGPHATIRSEDCIKDPNIDFVVVGEGERTICDLVDFFENKNKNLRKLKQIKGVLFKHYKKVVQNAPRDLIVDLDSMPFPARDLLNMEAYFRLAARGYSAEGVRRWFAVITSRGCPFNCCFCSASLINGKRWRFRSAQNVISELETLARTYGAEEIFFEDENMSLNKTRMQEICDLLVKKQLKFELFAQQGLRADTLDKKTLEKMHAAGFRRIVLAPESGVQRVVRDVIGKNLDLKNIEEVIKTCRKIGIQTSGYFVIGIPGETKDDIKNTLSYAKKLRRFGGFNFIFNNALPIVGTRMYKEAKEKGYLLKDGKELEESIIYDRHKHLLRTPEWGPEDIEAFYKRAIKENASSAVFSPYLWAYRLERLIAGLRSPRFIIKRILNRVSEFAGQRKVG